MKLLHIYSQLSYHTPAFIIGSHEGLVALREAIDKCLASNDIAETPSVYVNDGEGYKVYIKKEEFDDAESLAAKLAVPYTGEDAKFYPKYAVFPETLFDKEFVITESK